MNNGLFTREEVNKMSELECINIYKNYLACAFLQGNAKGPFIMRYLNKYQEPPVIVIDEKPEDLIDEDLIEFLEKEERWEENRRQQKRLNREWEEEWPLTWTGDKYYPTIYDKYFIDFEKEELLLRAKYH